MLNMHSKVRVLLLALICLMPSPVRGTGIPVIDAANLTQNVQQLLQTITMVTNTYQMIQNQVQQIQYKLESLKRLNPQNFSHLVSVANFQYNSVLGVVNGVKSVGYRLGQVRQKVITTFPDYHTFTAQNVSGAQAVQYRQQWNDTINEANHATLELQSLVQNVQERNQTLNNILATSQGEGGEVRQLQSIVQETAQVTHALNDLNVQTSTMNRVIGLKVAKELSEEALIRQQREQSAFGFTNPGTPVSVPNSLR